MIERPVSADLICKRLGINVIRLGGLLAEGALPRARQVGDQIGWDWAEVRRSSFVTEPERWTHKAEPLYGPGRVYYVAVEQYAKVGFTESVARRLSQFRTDNPHEVLLLHAEPGDRLLEARRHNQVRHVRHRGEWFERTGIEKFVEQLKNGRCR